MKKTKALSLLLSLLLLLSSLTLPLLAVDAETAADPEQTQTDSADAPAEDDSVPEDRLLSSRTSFSVAAKAALLIDLNTGRAVYEQDADERVYPASLTKIMTCLLALENGNLSDIVTIDEGAFAGLDGNSSTAGLQVGEQLTFNDLLYCLMISSGNEAANAVAEHIAGSIPDFVRMMNERAYELGCTDTHFANPHGLHDEEHYTTVRDLVAITLAALKSDNFRTITNTAVYELPATNLSPARELKTTNQLIDDSTSNSNYYSRAIGIKTGYTSKAGRCVISCAKGDGMYFLAVVCGAATTVLDTGDVRMESFPQCIRLFNYGFDQFSYVSIVSPLYPLAQITVNNSAASQVVSLAPAEEIRLLLPKDYDPQLLLVEPMPVSQSIDAPVYSGQVLGSVTVSYDGETLGTTDLLAINDVAKSDFNATVSGASSYIQKNWWKWVVFVIVLVLAGGVVFLIYLQLRKRQERQARMERRRKALEHRRRQQEDEPYGYYDDSNE